MSKYKTYKKINHIKIQKISIGHNISKTKKNCKIDLILIFKNVT